MYCYASVHNDSIYFEKKLCPQTRKQWSFIDNFIMWRIFYSIMMYTSSECFWRPMGGLWLTFTFRWGCLFDIFTIPILVIFFNKNEWSEVFVISCERWDKMKVFLPPWQCIFKWRKNVSQNVRIKRLPWSLVSFVFYIYV